MIYCWTVVQHIEHWQFTSLSTVEELSKIIQRTEFLQYRIVYVLGKNYFKQNFIKFSFRNVKKY